VTERHPLDRTGIEPEIALQLLVGYAAGHLAACHDAAKAFGCRATPRSPRAASWSTSSKRSATPSSASGFSWSR
jgi:hypothetical protein